MQPLQLRENGLLLSRVDYQAHSHSPSYHHLCRPVLLVAVDDSHRAREQKEPRQGRGQEYELEKKRVVQHALASNMILVLDVVDLDTGRGVAFCVLVNNSNFSHNSRETVVAMVKRGGSLSFQARGMAWVIGGTDLNINLIHDIRGREVKDNIPRARVSFIYQWYSLSLFSSSLYHQYYNNRLGMFILLSYGSQELQEQ